MTYDEIKNLDPEEVSRLQKENDDRISKELLLAFMLLIKVVFENGHVRLYLLNGDPIPISGTIGLNQLSLFLDTVISVFLKRVNTILTNGIEKSWLLGDLLSIGDIKQKVSASMLKNLSETGVFAHRQTALDTFINRKTNGLKLSERVWNLKGQVKFEIENTLQLGIIEGRSSHQIAQDLTRHLKEPEKLFRRIKDAKTGEFKLSKAAQNHNPGRGVYRSSYKNAMRLARNEINKAYRVAFYERIQSLPFVTGIKISLSNSHPDRMPKGDICDTLQGVYPKSFKWSGWHVQCMCRISSVMPPENELQAYLATHDTDHAHIPPQVDNYPGVMHAWIRDNKYRFKPDTIDWIDENKAVLAMMKG